MNQLQKKISSKIGPLYLVASETALHGIFWEEQPVSFKGGEASKAALILKKAQIQITEYLDGKRRDFDLPLDAKGTQFQKQVWKQLAKIPYGETRSYLDIAKAVKDKNASRAVGTANGRNPLSIVVPCHRVINTGGALGGYAGGLKIKVKLLNLEKEHAATPRLS